MIKLVAAYIICTGLQFYTESPGYYSGLRPGSLSGGARFDPSVELYFLGYLENVNIFWNKNIFEQFLKNNKKIWKHEHFLKNCDFLQLLQKWKTIKHNDLKIKINWRMIIFRKLRTIFLNAQIILKYIKTGPFGTIE